MAGGGTLGSGFAQLDQINQQIRDTRLQAELAMINDDVTRVTQQFDRHTQQMTQEYEAGLITAQQFMENLTANRTLALQGYATQITTMVQQNAQYLQMYSDEMARVQAEIDKAYQIIAGGLGIAEFDLNAVIEEFNAELGTAELDAAIEMWDAEQPTDAQTFFDNFITVVGTIFIALGPILGNLPWKDILGIGETEE